MCGVGTRTVWEVPTLGMRDRKHWQSVEPRRNCHRAVRICFNNCSRSLLLLVRYRFGVWLHRPVERLASNHFQTFHSLQVETFNRSTTEILSSIGFFWLLWSFDRTSSVKKFVLQNFLQAVCTSVSFKHRSGANRLDRRPEGFRVREVARCSRETLK